jgi:hypothetical protein
MNAIPYEIQNLKPGDVITFFYKKNLISKTETKYCVVVHPNKDNKLIGFSFQNAETALEYFLRFSPDNPNQVYTKLNTSVGDTQYRTYNINSIKNINLLLQNYVVISNQPKLRIDYASGTEKFLHGTSKENANKNNNSD